MRRVKIKIMQIKFDHADMKVDVVSNVFAKGTGLENAFLVGLWWVEFRRRLGCLVSIIPDLSIGRGFRGDRQEKILHPPFATNPRRRSDNHIVTLYQFKRQRL